MHVLLSTWCYARCLVDSGFATLKKLYRRSDVDLLDQLEIVVNRSSQLKRRIDTRHGSGVIGKQ